MTEAGAESGLKSPSVRMREILRILRQRDVVHGVPPEKLKDILEDLGPFYVKMGQLMSLHSDVLPMEYCVQLRKLHADVRPMPFDEVKAQIRAAYGREAMEIFAGIDPTPLGSASIAQVHKARLPNGRPVVVKVQRPLVRETVAQDINLLKKAIRISRAVTDRKNNIDLLAVLDELWRTICQETDFVQEAEHLRIFAELNRDVSYVTCPLPEPSLVTPKAFVMELVDGIPIDHLEQLKAAGYDIEEIGTKLAENYLKQVLDDGFFHADPHPGNLIIRDGQIVWIDLGMVGKLSERDRTLFKDIAFAMVRKDVSGLIDLLLTLGQPRGSIDHAALHADLDALLTKYEIMSLAHLDFRGLLKEMIGFVEKYDIILPPEIAIMVRSLVNMEGLLCVYCPDAKFISILSRHLVGEARREFDPQKELSSLGISLYSFLKKSLDLPTEISNILKMMLKGQFKVNLALTEANEPLSRLERMTDKLVLAILDAALFISAGLLCATDMTPKAWGAPLPGLICYALAIVIAIWLAGAIIRKKPRK